MNREIPHTHQLHIKKKAGVRQNKEILFVCLLMSGSENARTIPNMFPFHLIGPSSPEITGTET